MRFITLLLCLQASLSGAVIETVAGGGSPEGLAATQVSLYGYNGVVRKGGQVGLHPVQWTAGTVAF